MACECTGCCDTAFEDFPEQIYVRLEWSGDDSELDIHTTMYRRLVPAISPCNCISCTESIVYESGPIKPALLAPGLSRICCAAITLTGQCVEASDASSDTDVECEWTYSVAMFVDCYVESPISLSCKVEGSSTFMIDRSDMEECLDQDADNGDRTVTITFSELSPGGSEADECDKICCPDLPDTLYLTLESDCAELDGLVVPITRSAMTCRFFDISGFNTNQTNSVTWSGTMNICFGGRCANYYTFSATTNTYSTNPQCRWRISIGKEFECLTALVSENDTEFCLPVEFTLEDWGDPGDPELDFCLDECCPGDSGVTVTVTLSE